MAGAGCLVYRAGRPKIFFSLYILSGERNSGGTPSEILRPTGGAVFSKYPILRSCFPLQSSGGHEHGHTLEQAILL
jgi:hypothetical protein